jgi:hypothetical protein
VITAAFFGPADKCGLDAGRAEVAGDVVDRDTDAGSCWKPPSLVVIKRTTSLVLRGAREQRRNRNVRDDIHTASTTMATFLRSIWRSSGPHR